MPKRALIIGGGIGGLAAAIALRQARYQTAVFERAPRITEVGAGITLWSNAMRVLRALGVNSVEQESAIVHVAETRAWNGKLLSSTGMMVLNERLGAPTAGIHRADLQRCLAEAVGLDAIQLGKECTGYTHDDSGVTARFADGTEERGEILVAADGIHSRVRAQRLGASAPRYAGYTAWRGVAMIAGPEIPLGTTMLAMGRGSQFGYVPIGNGRTYWFATANVPQGGSDVPGSSPTVLLKRFRDWYAPVPAVIEATASDAILRNDIVDRPPVQGWGEGRVTLLGDAAHPTTPNMGQGACQAIEDAWVLAHCLRTPPNPEAGLRQYEQQRYARTAMVTSQSWQIGKILAMEHPVGCWIRDRMFSILTPLAMRQTERFLDAPL